MKKRNNIFLLKHLASAVVMLLALAWLTVSLPYVYANQQEQKELAKKIQLEQTGDDDGNPLSNTNEEKTESGNSTLSEYLHELHLTEHHFITLESFYKCHPSDLYFAFHPELLLPPPKA